MKKYVLLAMVILIIGGTFLNHTINYNKMDELEKFIHSVVRIEYGWGDVNKLDKICTDNFLDTAKNEELSFKKKLYTIEKILYKNSEEKIVVCAYVYSPDLTIHNYILVKNNEGKYLIDDILYDV